MREIFASGIRILGFGIGNTAQGIQNPTNQFHRQRLEPVPGIRNCRRGIQNPRMSYFLTRDDKCNVAYETSSLLNV